MLKIVGEPGSGKTRKLLIKAEKTGARVFCSSPSAMYEKAKAYGLNVNKLDLKDYDDFIGDWDEKKYYIDDLDKFLAFLNCSGYTLNSD